ncbi:MAG: hypothetical protein GTO02_10280 [Candidatus Dadabacteria bacterium]|nr:hypothetical protein [Candidatus Aenigmarchaeota archaeon]NIP30385.1 hypothetical protein [Candidatus Dadabacteria bacterium]NIQ14758.1 hypothetical protein [Candidatus Dadabacteria bacterium]
MFNIYKKRIQLLNKFIEIYTEYFYTYRNENTNFDKLNTLRKETNLLKGPAFNYILGLGLKEPYFELEGKKISTFWNLFSEPIYDIYNMNADHDIQP